MSDGANKNIKDLLEAFLRQSTFKKKLDQERIRELWQSLYGHNIAAYTQSLKLRDGILTVRLTSAPLRDELVRNRREIIRRLNEELGEEVITEIKFL
jgi:predicted nucleic acid-binding Zn ribbon protein